jgi:hypothetical protein
VSAFLSQQHRWNKGLIQTGLKLLPRILASPAPLKTKIEAWFHLTSPLVHLVILLLACLVVPAMFVTVPIRDLHPAAAMVAGLAALSLGACAACTFYVASQRGRGLGRVLLRMPALMAYGIGISVVNTRAVVEACVGHQSPFVRTPKFNGASSADADPVLLRQPRRLPPGVIEVGLGLAMLACFAVAFARPHTIIGAPFLLLFAVGYLLVGVPQVLARFASS